jgi:hypothetical protein
MEIIKQRPHRAAQVQELILHSCISKDFNKRTLYDIFPNAREVIIESSCGVRDPNLHFTELLDTTHLKSKVEILQDSDYCELATQLIHSNLCDRLKMLNLDFGDAEDDSRTIVAQLKNMPVLETLVLTSPHISVIDLEKLHENIPTIRDLELNFVTNLDSDLPVTITPISLNRFSYSAIDYEEQEAILVWYEYMSEKYIDVAEFDYEDDNLQHLDIDVIEQMYEIGLVQILQRVGQSKSNLTLYSVPDDVNVFEALDNSNCKINEFALNNCSVETLFPFLSQSNQSKHVETIKLVNTEINPSDSLQSLESLASVFVSFSDDDYGEVGVDSTSYLNAFPDSLEFLSISCPFLQFDVTSTRTNYINSLHIFLRELPGELGDVISTCFPHLTILELSGEVLEDLMITIQNPNFRNATFITDRPDTSDYGFSFKSDCQNKPLYYLCCSGGTELATLNDLQDVPTLSFVCSTRQKIDTSIPDFITIRSF